MNAAREVRFSPYFTVRGAHKNIQPLSKEQVRMRMHNGVIEGDISLDTLRRTLKLHPDFVCARHPDTYKSFLSMVRPWVELENDVNQALQSESLPRFIYEIPGIGPAVRFPVWQGETLANVARRANAQYCKECKPSSRRDRYPLNAIWTGSSVFKIAGDEKRGIIGAEDPAREITIYDVILRVKDSNQETLAKREKFLRGLAKPLAAIGLSLANPGCPWVHPLVLAIGWSFLRIARGPVNLGYLTTERDFGGFWGWLQTLEASTTDGRPVRSLGLGGCGFLEDCGDAGGSAGAALNPN